MANFGYKEKIRIGDTYNTRYTFYNPIAGTSDPDTDSPIDLTGITVTWHLQNGATLHSFDGSDGRVTVTAAEGLVEVEIPDEVTALWAANSTNAVTYLKFVYADGDEKTKAQRAVKVVKRETV